MNIGIHRKLRVLLAAILAMPALVRSADSPTIHLARASVGMMPFAAAHGRTIVHTRQFLPFEESEDKRKDADLSEQILNLLDSTQRRLLAYQANLSLALRLNVYLTRDADRPTVQGHIENLFKNDIPPISFVTTKLPAPHAKVALDCVVQALSSFDFYKMPKFQPQSPRSGRLGAEVGIVPIGSQIFVSGQAVRAENVKDATRKTMTQLGETLKWLDTGWTNVIHVKSFLNPMADVEDALTEIRSFFPESAVPSMSFVEWQYRNPIEIELVVAGGPDDPERPAVEYLTPDGMKASPVYCRVVRVNRGKLIYTSGIYGVPGRNPEREVRDIFEELNKSMSVFGSDMKHLVKATYYVADDEVSKALNELRPDYYDPQRPPAASKAKVAGTGLNGQKIVVDMIAVAPK